MRILFLIAFLLLFFQSQAQKVLIVGFENNQFSTKVGKRMAKKNKTSIKGLAPLLRTELIYALVNSTSQEVHYHQAGQGDTITTYFWRWNKIIPKTIKDKKKKKYNGLVINEASQSAIKAFVGQQKVDYVFFITRYRISYESTPVPSANGGISNAPQDVHEVDFEVYNQNARLVTGGRHFYRPKFTSKFKKMTRTFERIGRDIGRDIKESI
ncbi:hypothetical protein FNH22_03475 [Fulvivirga sp. M361]|uniref:hypothetical protein n=1 Tax=Fulvivirga sp. M361 TaxID=2594266 RepID=UPI00117AC38B|nr:hypothetical protein [Fulvivirga sp. M361]TRX61848.1 hypothetical protein FNH22_03475 [Fulvivirga sp. M361]